MTRPAATGTQAEYARHRGVSRQAVHAWLREGRLVVASGGRIDFGASDAALAAAGRTGHAVRDGETPAQAAERIVAASGAGMPLAEAERMKENYLALLRQLEYETKAGRLVDAEEVERQSFKSARIMRDAWMNWPQRVAATVAARVGCDPVAIAVVLEAEVREHLIRLADSAALSTD
jgi:hypothetical protein